MQQPLKLRGLATSCVRCRYHHAPLRSFITLPSSSNLQSRIQPLPTTCRSFNTSSALCKKGGKPSKSQDTPSKGTATSEAATDDPYDFSELEENINKAHAKLRDDLSKLRAGGRFNPDVIDDLRVQLDKASKDNVRLGDLAQVVPRGRILNVIAGDREHIKAISSAILSSDLSMTPQQDPQNPMQLNIPLPPPTKDSRQQAVQAANKAAETANGAIRNARQNQQKKLRAMQLNKSARPDDLKKAGDRMEKVVERGTAEGKKIADSAKKVLESG